MAKKQKKIARGEDRCRYGRSTRGPTKGRCRKSAPRKKASSAPTPKRAASPKRAAAPKRAGAPARRSQARTVNMREDTRFPPAVRGSQIPKGRAVLPYDARYWQ